MYKKIIIDLWYGDDVSGCDKVDCYFSDRDCVYRGNFYKGGRMVGDYTAATLQDIEKLWNNAHSKEAKTI